MSDAELTAPVSDTAETDYQSMPPLEIPERDDGPPVALADFAVTLRPPLIRDGRGRVVGVGGPGHPDEIWLKHLSRMHGRERHTMAGWAAIIDRYRHEPAHPMGMVS